MNGEATINTKVLEVEVKNLRRVAEENGRKIDKLTDTLLGNGGSPSVVTKLAVLELDHKKIVDNEKEIKNLNKLKNRMIGFAMAIGGGSGTIASVLVKVLGG